jgi:hypothetical membrane protein
MNLFESGESKRATQTPDYLYFWSVKVLRFVTLFFVVCVAIAICFYPGGNIHDPSQLGYSFTHNFLSDLGGYTARSGEQNFLSSFFFNMAVFLFSAVGVGFLFVPQLFTSDPLGYRLAIMGSLFFVLGMAFFAGVGLTPYDLYTDLHIFFALNAFRLLIPGALLYIIVIYRSPVKNSFTFLTIVYLISVTAYVIYQMTSGSALESEAEMVNQASIQKVIVLISILSTFSLTYAFSFQFRLLQKKAP